MESSWNESGRSSLESIERATRLTSYVSGGNISLVGTSFWIAKARQQVYTRSRMNDSETKRLNCSG